MSTAGHPVTILKPLLLALLLGAPLCSTATALDLQREEVRRFIDTMVGHGLDRASVEQLLKGARTQQTILDAISRPAERVVPWHEYRDRFLTELRIQQGASFRLAHGEKLKQLGDDQLANTVVGILGVETSYGRITGRYKVLDALVTLGFDYPPRANFFRSELEHFLLLSREEAIDPATAQGSYAGAMGSAQFISSSYRRWAVDGDGDGKRDLWGSWDDVVASIANYLTDHGWVKQQQVVVPATLAAGVDAAKLPEAKLELNHTVQSLRDAGLVFSTDLPAQTPAMLVVGQGKDGPLYRVGFRNFFVITRYNRSTMYAMAVHDLGDAIENFMRDAEQ